jgi:dipeptidyl aminopeptidase/acylaminoacyl peptidase
MNMSTPRRIAYGETEDAESVLGAGLRSEVAVQVAAGLGSRIDIVNADGTSFTLYETEDEGLKRDQWGLESLGGGRYAFAALRSSAVKGDLEDVWYGILQKGEKGKLTTRLSYHNKWHAGRRSFLSKSFTWTASDGKELQGIIAFPPNVPLKNLPTVVVPHGGPYWFVNKYAFAWHSTPFISQA